MNFKMFEDKNWFQLIRNRVLRLSDGSVIKQDLLSTLLLINFFAYLYRIILLVCLRGCLLAFIISSEIDCGV